MVIDARHDHSIRIPRPDLSIKLGTPNACNLCHMDESEQWASDAVNKWYSHPSPGVQRFAETLQEGEEGAPGAERALDSLVANREQPAIARGSALSLLATFAPAPTDAAVQIGVKAGTPLIRRGAVRALSNSDPKGSIDILGVLLNDPVRTIRVEAAETLAGLPAELLSPTRSEALSRATGEYIAAQELDADRPEAHMNLGLLFAREGKLDRAET